MQVVAEKQEVKKVWHNYYKDALNQKNKARLDLKQLPPVYGPEKAISKGVIRALSDMKVGKSIEESEVTTELLKAGDY
jgi:hypothetical protein